MAFLDFVNLTPFAAERLFLLDEAGREILLHSTAHLMAQAVKRLFPEAELGIGPPIEDGFYYDFDKEKLINFSIYFPFLQRLS